MPGDRHIRVVPTGSSPIPQSSAQPEGVAWLAPVQVCTLRYSFVRVSAEYPGGGAEDRSKASRSNAPPNRGDRRFAVFVASDDAAYVTGA